MTALPRATVEDWLARAAAVDPRTELFVDGRFVPAVPGLGVVLDEAAVRRYAA